MSCHEPASPKASPSVSRAGAARPALMLGTFSLATALILGLSDDLTRPAIAARATEDLNASLLQVLPPEDHDNDPGTTERMVVDGVEGTVPVYLAVEGQQVTGVAFELTGYGYGGAIRVLLGIAPDGSLLGVRVLSHAETPGLGDKIEVAKDGWILGFAGRSLADPLPDKWKVKRDGGVFDQFSGATITPRAVVATVHRGLEMFARQSDVLLAPLGKEAGQ